MWCKLIFDGYLRVQAPVPAPAPSSCLNLTTILADPELSQFVTLGRVSASILLSVYICCSREYIRRKTPPEQSIVKPCTGYVMLALPISGSAFPNKPAIEWNETVKVWKSSSGPLMHNKCVGDISFKTVDQHISASSLACLQEKDVWIFKFVVAACQLHIQSGWTWKQLHHLGTQQRCHLKSQHRWSCCLGCYPEPYRPSAGKLWMISDK